MAKPAVLHGGFYDISRLEELRGELNAIEPHSDVTIDLAKTSHLDCACLGLMARRLREWRSKKPDTQLRLRNVPKRLTDVLSTLKLDELFIVESNRR